MFTRFKLLTMVFFFLLSFMLVTLYWGENGYFERKTMKSNLSILDAEAKEREMELSLLRERNEYRNERDNKDLELIYSFDDDESINGYESKTLIKEYEGLKLWECALWALVPTFIYFIFISIVPLFFKKKNKKNRKNTDYGSSN